MTDKVHKIREVVERLQKRAEHNFDISLTENERQFWLGESNVLTLIGKYIDSLQEEPVNLWHDASKIPDNSEDIVIEHSEYGITIIPACKMSRVKGAKWARLDDILKL